MTGLARTIMLLFAVVLIAGCGSREDSGGNNNGNSLIGFFDGSFDDYFYEETKDKAGADMKKRDHRNNIYYEIFVRSFYDSDGDGIGDLRGIIEKLDYLNDGRAGSGSDLEIDAIWLMPIYPSPTYHGYDITDYYNVNPDYGTLDDFRELTEKAHERGIKVILDLAINNTSSEHPWFLDAASNPESPYRDWYIWAEDRGLPVEGVGPFGNASPWHRRGNAHYMGIYHHSMPDLNYDNPEVRAEMIRIGQFWLEQGADGFRLDSAKHLYWKFHDSGQKPETHQKNVAWWQEFRAGLLEVTPDVYLVGEVWDTNEVIAPFLDRALDSGFNFVFAYKIVEMVKNGKDSEGLGKQLKRVHEMYGEASNGAYIDAVFLSNHDQDRVFSQLGRNWDLAKVAASVLLTLPGNPFIYYGEEIGMHGTGPHEYIREPLVWRVVEEQLRDENSLLSHYRKMIRLRNRDAVIRYGKIDGFDAGNERVCAYIMHTDDDRRLVLHNLTGEPQTAKTLGDDAYGTFENIVFATVKDGGIGINGGEITIPAYQTVVLK